MPAKSKRTRPEYTVAIVDESNNVLAKIGKVSGAGKANAARKAVGKVRVAVLAPGF